LRNFKEPKVLLAPAEIEHAAQELKIFREELNNARGFLREKQTTFLGKVFQPKVPLFLVIGADTAGKSSLLTHSGLGLIDANYHAISNPMSTRYCHFWFAEGGVFVDTAGTYTMASSTDLSTNVAWRGLIKLLRSYKRRCPLSGLIIAIDLPALSQDRNRLEATLASIKQRIYEISKYASELPIFVVLTKADLIAGFKDFFANLNTVERQQLFGLSFRGRHDRPVQAFEDKFKALLQRLHEYMLERLLHESQMEKRARIKDFPLQIESLKATIATIVNEIPSNAQTRLNGIYFTSSLQKGQPIDYLHTSVTSVMDLQAAVAEANANRNAFVAPAASAQQTYFLQGLFEQMLYAAKSAHFGATKKKIEFSSSPKLVLPSILLALGISILGSVFLYFNYRTSAASIVALHEIFSRNNNTQVSNDIDQLYLMKEKTAAVARTHFWRILKVAALEKTAVEAQQKYNLVLTNQFMPALQADLEMLLENPNNKDVHDLYATFKAYLMLSDPKKIDNNYLQKWFASYWAKNINDVGVLKRQDLYLKDALKLGLKFNANSQLLARMHNNLMSLPVEELIYTIFRNEQSAKYTSLDVSNLKNSTFDFSSLNISQFYTRPQLDQVLIKDNFDKFAQNILQNDWVLTSGQDAPRQLQDKDLVAFKNKARELYLNDYVATWQTALHAVKITGWQNLAQADQELQVLAGDNSPLLNVLNLVRVNTAAPILNNQFQDLSNVDTKKLQAVLRELTGYCQSISLAQNSGQVAWQATVQSMQNNQIPAALETLRVFAEAQPEPLKSWLMQINDSTWKVLLWASKDYLNTLWSAQVVPVFNKTLNDTYPLFKEAKDMADLNDFTNFFGPKGIVDNFFTSYVRPFVDVSHNYWVWKTVAGQQLPVPQETLEMFIRATLIQKMFYPNGTKNVETHFSLTPLALDPSIKSFTLNVDGQPVIASAEQMLARWLTWPGPQPGNVSLEFVKADNSVVHNSVGGGAWAWFKLLADSNLQATTTPQRFEVTFVYSGNSVRYLLTAARAINPFIPDIINNFRCVEKL
jgi:type VI secretion system protein ImpL